MHRRKLITTYKKISIINLLPLQFTKSTSNLMEGARSREKLIALLKDHEKYSTEVKEHRETIRELDFLLKQVQKEIKTLRTKVTGFEIVSMRVPLFYP